jgi:hypothetical protein
MHAVQEADRAGDVALGVRVSGQLAEDARLTHGVVPGLQKLSWSNLTVPKKALSGHVRERPKGNMP